MNHPLSYRDRNGQPIDAVTWARHWTDFSYRWVVRTFIDQVEVRTIWQGIADLGMPLFYCGVSSDGGTTWKDAGSADTEDEARAVHAKVVNAIVDADDPWYRQVRADGTIWVDIKRTRDGRILCQICCYHVPPGQLADGTDICAPCAAIEQGEKNAAMAYWEGLPATPERPTSWQQAWNQATPEDRLRYRALFATTPKDSRHA